MPRFFIEVPHESDETSCTRAIQIFLQTGSHFLTNADWGCLDGDHNAWIIADVDSKEEARQILPPVYRSQARIVELNKFSYEGMNEIISRHKS